MKRKKTLLKGSILSVCLMAMLMAAAVFAAPATVNAATDPIDWSVWENSSEPTQRVMETHAQWYSSGITEVPTFSCNTDDPAFVILNKDNTRTALVEGTDYKITYMGRVYNHQSEQLTVFDKSKPGDYTFKLEGMNNYTGTATVRFALTSSGDFGQMIINTPSMNLNEHEAPVFYIFNSKGEAEIQLQEGRDYIIKEVYIGNSPTPATTWNFDENGSYAAQLEGQGDYTGTTWVSFNVGTPLVRVTLSTAQYVYSGTAKAPIVYVKDIYGNAFGTANYTVTNPKTKAIGKYTVKVTFKNGYVGSETVSYTVVPKATPIKSLSRLSKGFKVTWNKSASANATGYEIKYSLKSSMASSKTVKVTSYKTASKSIKKLKAKKTYYVQMRTYKKVGTTTYYSSWSTKKSVKTK